MKTSLRLVLIIAFAAASAFADGPFRNRDNKSANDIAEGTYPIPYQLPTVAEVTESLGRMHSYLDTAAPTRVIDSATGKEITDFANPVANRWSSRSVSGRSYGEMSGAR